MPPERLVLTAVLGPLVAAGAFVCALAALLAQLGRRSAAWDVLTHGAPLYLAGGLLGVATSFLLEGIDRDLALVSGAVAVVAASALIAPVLLRPAGPRAGADHGPTLKLIQFNVWGGRGGVERAAAWLVAQRPDVVVMQETNRTAREAIAARTGLFLTLARANVAIFSRAPPVAAPEPGPGLTPMSLNRATFRTPAGDAVILGVHYPWPTEYERLRQAEALIALVRALPSDTTILAGDFNSTPWSFARRREEGALGLIRRTRAVFSWPAGRWGFGLLPIDHVYAGSAWATVEVRRGPYLGSDHYPIIVTLAPRAPPPAAAPISPAGPPSSPPPPPGASPAPRPPARSP